MKVQLALVTCLLGLAATVARAQEAKPPAAAITARPIIILECPVVPMDDVKVPAQVAGVLLEVPAKLGTVAVKDQLLAQIDDKLARIELESKTLAAKNTAPVAAAIAQEAVAQADLESATKLFKSRTISVEEFHKAEAQLKVAVARREDAVNKQGGAEVDQKQAEEQVRRYRVLCPVNAQVVEQYKQLGEAVQVSDPIFRVVRTDVVKVKGIVNYRDADFIRPGTEIEIFPGKPEAEVRRMPGGHTGEVNAVRVLGDGLRCVSGGSDGRIIVWNVARGDQERRLTGHEGAVNCLGTTPANPNQLVSGGQDGVLRVWDLTNGSLTKSIPTNAGPIHSIAVDPRDPKRCLIASFDRKIRLWNVETGAQLKEFAGHTSFVWSLATTDDGLYLLSADDQYVRFWDIEAGKELQVFRGKTPEVRQLGMTGDGKNYLFNNESVLEIRSLPADLPVASFEQERKKFRDVALFVPNSGMVLTGDESHRLQLWQHRPSPLAPRLVRVYDRHDGPIKSVDFAPDGSFFVSGSADRSVRVWRVPTLKEIEKERKRGTIQFVNQVVEAGGQNFAIQAEVDNKDGVLRPGSFASIVIYPDRGISQQPTAH